MEVHSRAEAEQARLARSGRLVLPEGEVHVWYASTAGAAQHQDDYAALLSDDERRRAERFYFEADRARFIVVRGMLRRLLGRYLGLDPAQVEFSYGEYGKPEIKATGASPLHFNISHAGDGAILAFAPTRRVGVDVERVRSVADESRFAKQLFAASESAVLDLLSGEERQRAFFQIWTAKEAFLKAVGMGLTVPLDRIEVGLGPDGRTRLASVDGDPKQSRGWQLESFSPSPGYQASVAIEGRGCRIVLGEIENLPHRADWHM